VALTAGNGERAGAEFVWRGRERNGCAAEGERAGLDVQVAAAGIIALQVGTERVGQPYGRVVLKLDSLDDLGGIPTKSIIPCWSTLTPALGPDPV